MKKCKVVVICPGRGSYTRESIGFINKYGSDVFYASIATDARTPCS